MYVARMLGVLLCAQGVSRSAHAQDSHATDGPAAAGSQQPQEAAVPEQGQTIEEARAHFDAGFEHFRARRFRESIQEFELAGRLMPNADLWYNIARAREELGEFELAVDYYRRYLRDRVDPPDRAEVEQHIGRLAERVQDAHRRDEAAAAAGTLRVRVNEDGARVSLDGRVAGRTPLEDVVGLSPGVHSLWVQAHGQIPARSDVLVSPGRVTTAYVDLEPSTVFRTTRESAFYAWFAAAGSGAALAGSAYFAIRAIGQQPDSGGVSEADDQRRVRARRSALASDVLLGAAIGSGVVAVILYFAETRAVRSERQARSAHRSVHVRTVRGSRR